VTLPAPSASPTFRIARALFPPASTSRKSGAIHGGGRSASRFVETFGRPKPARTAWGLWYSHSDADLAGQPAAGNVAANFGSGGIARRVQPVRGSREHGGLRPPNWYFTIHLDSEARVISGGARFQVPLSFERLKVLGVAPDTTGTVTYWSYACPTITRSLVLGPDARTWERCMELATLRKLRVVRGSTTLALRSNGVDPDRRAGWGTMASNRAAPA
jgi:hypothetical protein